MNSVNATAAVPSEVLRSVPMRREPRAEAGDAATPTVADLARGGAAASNEPAVDAGWEAALDRATD